MSTAEQSFDHDAEAHIQACLLDEQVADEHLEAVAAMLRTDGEQARAVALRLLDDRLIHSWFRSEADPSFIDEVRRRLELRFADSAFVDAAMGRIQDLVHAEAGSPGTTIRRSPSRRHSAVKYLLVPLAAALIYVLLAYHQQLLNFFHDPTNETMTVQDFAGQPILLAADREKTVIRKLLVRPGEAVKTDAQATVTMTYPDETRVVLKPQSRLQSGTTAAQKELTLAAGAASLTISQQSKDRPVAVITPNGEITMTAGQMEIRLSEDTDLIMVTAGEAMVRKLSGGEPLPVGTGQTAEISVQKVVVR